MLAPQTLVAESLSFHHAGWGAEGYQLLLWEGGLSLRGVQWASEASNAVLPRAEFELAGEGHACTMQQPYRLVQAGGDAVHWGAVMNVAS